MNNLIAILSFVILTSQNAFAQAPTPSPSVAAPSAQTQKMDLPAQKVETAMDPRIKESYEIIDDIKSKNPPDNFRVELRSGLTQIFANSTDTVELNRLKSLPFGGVDILAKLYENTALEFRYTYAKNILFEPSAGSPNKTSAQWTTYDGGLRYRIVIDPTSLDDNAVIKILYHTESNNFKLNDTSGVFMKSYTGYILGFERSIPVTPKILILASLDINFIQDAKSDSNTEFIKTGIGFHTRGGVYYRTDWFGTSSRIGAHYWQGGMVNRFSPSVREDSARTSHVQTFRSVSLSYMVHF